MNSRVFYAILRTTARAAHTPAGAAGIYCKQSHDVKIPLAVLIAGFLICPGTQAESDTTCQNRETGTVCEDNRAEKLAQDAGTATPAVDSADETRQPPDSSGPEPVAPAVPTAWDTCPPTPKRDYTPRPPGPDALVPTLLGSVKARRDGDMHYSLTGNAVLERGIERLQADRIDYDKRDATVEASGHLIYDNPDQQISAKNGKFWLEEDRGELENIEYRFYDRHARGKADRAYLDEPGVTRFEDATYTTCPDGSKVWRLKAERVDLDQNEGTGTARGARLEIKSVPVLYTPFLSFPIDDRRKSGFLVPSFGQSDNSGFDLRVPYYFNLAPNYDATFTPRFLANRGLQLNSEFRNLRPNGNSSLELEFMPNDKITDQRRGRLIFHDRSRFGRHLNTRIDYDRISDKTYLDDLGDSLSLASVTFLQRTAQASYATDWWNLTTQLDDYQILDRNLAPDSRPYQRLPRVTFSATPPIRPFGAVFQLNSELVNFRQDSRVTGRRADIWPRVSLPWRRTAYEVVPSLSYRLTQYDLNHQQPGVPSTITRALPVVSLDNHLFLERNFSLAGRQLTQTLEPRLFYLYVAGRDQKDIPLFDTSEPTFNYRELFVENRFTGADRMGDANQAALSLTSRLIDADSGVERMRASIGQLFYFQNRTVTLDNSAARNETLSDIAGELDLTLSPNWSVRADTIINPRDVAAERANVRFQYHPGFRKIANIAYRYRRSEQNQVDTSVLWPLGRNWHFVGRWYYDIGATKTLEKMAGLEYDSCCWGVRLVVRNFIDNEDKANNNTILLQLVLKGLTRIGSNVESVLEDGILGYTRSPEE